jgi:hypothetical protein
MSDLTDALEWAEKHLSEGATLASHVMLDLVRRARAELGEVVAEVEGVFEPEPDPSPEPAAAAAPAEEPAAPEAAPLADAEPLTDLHGDPVQTFAAPEPTKAEGV